MSSPGGYQLVAELIARKLAGQASNSVSSSE